MNRRNASTSRTTHDRTHAAVRHRAARPLGAVVIGALGLAAPVLIASPSFAAEQGTSIVTRSVSGSVELQAATSTRNDVQVFLDAGQLAIIDAAGVVAGTGCTLVNPQMVRCGTGVTNVGLLLGDSDDEVRVQTGVPTTVLGEAGNDFFHGGLTGAEDSQAFYDGGIGFDTVSYSSADARVTVTVGTSGTGNDGRSGDRDSVQSTVEKVIGSGLPDSLTGDGLANILVGGNGADIIVGGSGNDTFEEGTRTSGADDITGGAGLDTVEYVQRTADLRVSLNGVADDGEGTEGDNVRTDVERIVSGAGDDTLTGSAAGDTIFGGPGVDRVQGGRGADQLIGQGDSDTLIGGGGADTIDAFDATDDDVACGAGVDNATVDAGQDDLSGCENVR